MTVYQNTLNKFFHATIHFEKAMYHGKYIKHLTEFFFDFQYKKRLVEAQVQLEHELRKEEDEMFKVFQMERENEKRKLTDEIKKEWEVKLKELTDMYEKTMAKKKKKMPDEERKVGVSGTTVYR